VLLFAGSRAKVTDFGMAKLYDVNHSKALLTSDGGGQVHDQHNALAHPLDTATAIAAMPEEALQQHILNNNPSTDAIMTISPPLGISPPLSPTTGSQ